MFVATLMFGGKGCLTINRGPGPAIDIDVKEAYLSLVRNDEENFRRVARYLNEIGPGKVPVPPAGPSTRRGEGDFGTASEEHQAEQAHHEKH